MESHIISARLHVSRERMRALLIPDALTGRIDADTFPRSALMQFAFNARARRVALAVVSLFLMFRRSRKLTGLAQWPPLLRSVGGLIGALRH